MDCLRRIHLTALQRGGAVVIAGDLPPEPQETALFQPFLGATCGFAPGAAKLAKITHATFAAFVCEFNNGTYCLRFSSSGEEPYAFIDRVIRHNPSAWWAADLLPLLPESDHEEQHM